MNFLCHALPYLDRPMFVAGTAVPDWLSVVDRRVRARGKLARRYVDSSDPELREVALGIVQHHYDDGWFHGTRAFTETNLQLAVQLRDLLPGDEGFRPSFVAHILIEMLLDALWIRDDESLGHRYYALLHSVSPARVQRCVNLITGQPTVRLAGMIERFVEVRFLYDYLDEAKLLMRLNQVMHRVGLAPLPPAVGHWLPQATHLVESRRRRLLSPPDAISPFPFERFR